MRVGSLPLLTSIFASVCMLVACGGGGDDGAGASASPSGARDAEGRVTYTWSFENKAGAALAPTFLPDVGGRTDQTLMACIDDGKWETCRVGVEPGKSGAALRFSPTLSDNPAITQSYAWLRGANGGKGLTCEGRVLQFSDGSFVPGAAKLGFAVLDQRISVALHIKADRLDGGAEYHLFGNQNPIEKALEGGEATGQSNASFHLRLKDGVPTLSIYPEGFAETPDIVLALNDHRLEAGRWYHLAFTYQTVMESDTPVSYVSMFVDGVQVLKKDRNEGRTVKERQRLIKESCLPYYLGGLSTNGFEWSGVQKAFAAPKGLVFPGLIDNLVFSNQALQPSQIAALANK